MGFQQGLSGLNASAKNLDVIGHNIANSNTTGFKSSRTEFAAMVASAVGTAGGINSGIGVEVGAIAQQFNQGNLTVTGNSLDVAINGNGFFTLQMPDGSRGYTRDGSFKLDTFGNVVTNSGAKVMGYPTDPDTGLRTSSTASPLTFPTSAPIPAKQTTKISAAFNLDARAPDAAGNPAATPPVPATPRSTYGTSINVYDSQGVATAVNLYFEKTANPNEWNVYDSLDPAAPSRGTITFDGDGKITGPAPTPPATGFQLPLQIDPSLNNPNAGPTAPNAPNPFTVTLSLDNVTQFGTKFAVSELTQDGYTSGQLTGINIGDDGVILTRYSNGVTRAEGQVVLASFRNTQGLAAMGGNTWVETYESGQPTFGAPTDGNFGSLRAGALEDSNVDLTAELVNMMTAQRAYQANAQTIKTQDQVMSTLVNLR
ncbi:flagellar hook protein FlgE [Pulveribacter sp.]|uniref:flagellar hook protein FlgE n=1 Tax=Pulveribacter sp. TaxID=2678893 RepID=UPI0028A1DCFE|nr:flagellar hook protein FlgE [Pulveribacter sp.]